MYRTGELGGVFHDVVGVWESDGVTERLADLGYAEG